MMSPGTDRGAARRHADLPWHAMDVQTALDRIGAATHGLATAEAQRRLAEYGANRLRLPPPASVWRILIAQFQSVVVALLGAATLVAAFSGDRADAIAIAFVLVLNATLGFVTELRARRAMEALRALETPTAVVIRDGASRELPAADLVPGDVIILEAGQSVPADARAIEAVELRTVEASLTGESLPADKRADVVLAENAPLADRVNMLFQGTSVVAGAARGVIVATGDATEVGRIGLFTSTLGDEPTPLERKLDVLGRRLVWLALAVGAVVASMSLVRGTTFVEVFALGVALAVAAVPEGLPVVATVALAVGVARLARRQALVRRLPAVETLGAVTVVCSDKTGTLTAGAMTVTTLVIGDREIRATGIGYAPEGTLEMDGEVITASANSALGEALRIAILANRSAISRDEQGWHAIGDPTEAALLVAAAKGGLDEQAVRRAFPEIGQVPFSSERKWMATFHSSGTGVQACVKGAPGAVLDRSSHLMRADGTTQPLDDAMRAALAARNDRLARRGLRVLALAHGNVRRPAENEVSGLTLVGLVGMADPPAAGVRETIARLRAAGVRTLMITGDQRSTASAVARELDLTDGPIIVIEGQELADIPDDRLPDRLRETTAVCRVSPMDKLRIVRALQQNGEIVAMLGDGVNDAAALRKADIGVAMGLRGTDVAKDAADMVLADDRFVTIGEAVEGGRVVFDNIRKFVFYLFSCNLAEVMVLFVAGLVGNVAMLTPLQILWLNLVTDTFPALALAIEPADPGVMHRPPRDPDKAILSASFLRGVAFYAALITLVTFAAYYATGASDPRAGRTAAFMTLALAQALHLGTGRSRDPVVSPERALANRWAIGALVSVFALQALAVLTPQLRSTLDIATLGAREWAIVLGLATVPAIVGQAIRLPRLRGVVRTPTTSE